MKSEVQKIVDRGDLLKGFGERVGIWLAVGLYALVLPVLIIAGGIEVLFEKKASK